MALADNLALRMPQTATSHHTEKTKPPLGADASQSSRASTGTGHSKTSSRGLTVGQEMWASDRICWFTETQYDVQNGCAEGERRQDSPPEPQTGRRDTGPDVRR